MHPQEVKHRCVVPPAYSSNDSEVTMRYIMVLVGVDLLVQSYLEYSRAQHNRLSFSRPRQSFMLLVVLVGLPFAISPTLLRRTGDSPSHHVHCRFQQGKTQQLPVLPTETRFGVDNQRVCTRLKMMIEEAFRNERD